MENDEIDSDITIINANLLIGNKLSKEEITQSLLNENADIYILIEAACNHNVDTSLFKSNGYTLFQLKNEPSSDNLVIATRIQGEFGVIKNQSATMSTNSSGSLRIPFNSLHLSIVGIHLPAPIYNSKEEIDFSFKEMKKLGQNGRVVRDVGSIIQGDYLILAGDFNSLPNDKNMKIPLEMGLEDAATVAANPYQYTWSTQRYPTDFARIDYLFASPDIQLVYNKLIEIPGSDHKGIKTGIDY